MPNYTVEKDWISNHGYRCVIIMHKMGHYCGYVGIPVSHPFHGEDYSAKPKWIQGLKDALMEAPVGKRGIIDILTMGINGELRIGDLFDVHGSLTFSGGMQMEPYPVPSKGLWWFGYDCGHAGDGKDLSVVDDSIRKIEEKYPTDGIFRDLDYCTTECESLAKQLKEVGEHHANKQKKPDEVEKRGVGKISNPS